MFDKDTFKLMALSTTFPYCEIPSTRHGFRVKWLLFDVPKSTVLFKRSTKYAVPASSVGDMEAATDLIVKKQALPLPNDYADIMDVMEWWGRTVSPLWHQTVLDLMYYNLKNERNISRENLFYRCIAHRVEDMLNSLTINSDAAPAIMEQWIAFFENIYKYETKDYFGCCVNSFRFVENKVEHAQQVSVLANVVDYSFTSEDDSVHSAGVPDIIPPTPVSSRFYLPVESTSS